RVRAMLRIKALQDTVQEQAGRLADQAGELALWNQDLEARVRAQLGQIERMGALKRFLAPQLAELIMARGEDSVLQTHRRDIVVVFGDLRGYTAFAETAEPEELLDLLNAYHAAVGPIVTRSEGTLDHFSGDGIMVFFNDPLPCPDAAERAVRMAVEMREALLELQTEWKKRGRQIGFGIGIGQGRFLRLQHDRDGKRLLALRQSLPLIDVKEADLADELPVDPARGAQQGFGRQVTINDEREIALDRLKHRQLQRRLAPPGSRQRDSVEKHLEGGNRPLHLKGVEDIGVQFAEMREKARAEPQRTGAAGMKPGQRVISGLDIVDRRA